MSRSASSSTPVRGSGVDDVGTGVVAVSDVLVVGTGSGADVGTPGTAVGPAGPVGVVTGVGGALASGASGVGPGLVLGDGVPGSAGASGGAGASGPGTISRTSTPSDPTNDPFVVTPMTSFIGKGPSSVHDKVG